MITWFGASLGLAVDELAAEGAGGRGREGVEVGGVKAELRRVLDKALVGVAALATATVGIAGITHLRVAEFFVTELGAQNGELGSRCEE